MLLSEAIQYHLESSRAAKDYLHKLKACKSSPGQQAAIFHFEELMKSSDELIKQLIIFNTNNVSMLNPDYQRFYDHFKKYFHFKKISNFIIK